MLNLAMLRTLAERYPASKQPVARFSVGNRLFDPTQTPSLMGVVNLSNDSWYRESVVLNTDAAIQRGRVLHEQGAAVIDLGAESSGVRAARVGDDAQKSALLPVVKDLASAGILVSVETYHPTVTEACLVAGARILNLTGAVDRSGLYERVAAYDAAVVICFVLGAHVREVNDLQLGTDPIGTLYEYFAREVEVATRAGVTRLWIDPGLGFYYRNLVDPQARLRHQMRIFLNSHRLSALGWPLCQTLPNAFACFEDEVRAGEPFFAVWAALGGNHLLRTHELTKVRGVLRAMEAIRALEDLVEGEL